MGPGIDPRKLKVFAAQAWISIEDLGFAGPLVKHVCEEVDRDPGPLDDELSAPDRWIRDNGLSGAFKLTFSRTQEVAP